MGQPFRSWLIAATVAGFAGVVLLAALIAVGATEGVDVGVRQLAAQHSSIISLDVAFVFTLLGYAPGLVPVAAAGILAMVWFRRSPSAIVPGLSLALAEVANRLLKLLFARSRPEFDATLFDFSTLDRFSFPSGHAMDSMALYFVLFIWALLYLRGTARAVTSSILIAMPLLIGSSRVALGVHWVSDVFGGWLAGVALAGFLLLAWDWATAFWKRRTSRGTQEPG